MHFSEHPTWNMLETGKKYFKYLEETSSNEEICLTARAAMISLQSLQLEVEDRILLEGGDDE